MNEINKKLREEWGEIKIHGPPMGATLDIIGWVKLSKVLEKLKAKDKDKDKDKEMEILKASLAGSEAGRKADIRILEKQLEELKIDNSELQRQNGDKSDSVERYMKLLEVERGKVNRLHKIQDERGIITHSDFALEEVAMEREKSIRLEADLKKEKEKFQKYKIEIESTPNMALIDERDEWKELFEKERGKFKRLEDSYVRTVERDGARMNDKEKISKLEEKVRELETGNAKCILIYPGDGIIQGSMHDSFGEKEIEQGIEFLRESLIFERLPKESDKPKDGDG